jgi:hypothetical protein
LAPLRRASDKPIAIACFLLLTFFPERPDFSLPRLRSCIARLTLLDAFVPYFLREDLVAIGLLPYQSGISRMKMAGRLF